MSGWWGDTTTRRDCIFCNKVWFEKEYLSVGDLEGRDTCVTPMKSSLICWLGFRYFVFSLESGHREINVDEAT